MSARSARTGARGGDRPRRRVRARSPRHGPSRPGDAAAGPRAGRPAARRAVVVLGVAAGPLLAPYSPNEQIPGANLLGPSAAHWLGTDDVNRDILSRTLYGIRVDLRGGLRRRADRRAARRAWSGWSSTTFAVADVVTQRVFDVVLAFPTLILAIALTAFIGPGRAHGRRGDRGRGDPGVRPDGAHRSLVVREMPYVESSQRDRGGSRLGAAPPRAAERRWSR